jgi:hypothetical protein
MLKTKKGRLEKVDSTPTKKEVHGDSRREAFFNKAKEEDIVNEREFVYADQGSATWASLDGRSEDSGYVTEGAIGNKDLEEQTTDLSTRGAPWALEPSLEAKCEEVGINFDNFIEGLKNNKSDAEMAEEFEVTEKTIFYLRDYFEHMGLDTMMGQD